MSAHPPTTTQSISYREYIYHPAIPDPIVTAGTLDIGRNDTLIRNQTDPSVETTEIGKRFITVRRGDYENTTLIPAQLQPLLNVLREIVLRERFATDSFVSRLRRSNEGWTLSLMPNDEAGEVILIGCGETLSAIHYLTGSGERRETHFVRSQ